MRMLLAAGLIMIMGALATLYLARTFVITPALQPQAGGPCIHGEMYGPVSYFAPLFYVIVAAGIAAGLATVVVATVRLSRRRRTEGP